jgi:hypothetical protein
MAGLVPAIPFGRAQLCQHYRDARDKRGHDEKKKGEAKMPPQEQG